MNQPLKHIFRVERVVGDVVGHASNLSAGSLSTTTRYVDANRVGPHPFTYSESQIKIDNLIIRIADGRHREYNIRHMHLPDLYGKKVELILAIYEEDGEDWKRAAAVLLPDEKVVFFATRWMVFHLTDRWRPFNWLLLIYPALLVLGIQTGSGILKMCSVIGLCVTWPTISIIRHRIAVSKIKRFKRFVTPTGFSEA